MLEARTKKLLQEKFETMSRKVSSCLRICVVLYFCGNERVPFFCVCFCSLTFVLLWFVSECGFMWSETLFCMNVLV